MNFWRPTKVTWISFIVLVVLNIAAPFVGVLLNNYVDFPRLEYALFFIPIYQVFGLAGLFSELGVDVFAHEAFIPSPNAFGWLLAGYSILFFLFVYYFLASLISYAIYRRRVK